jgi:hypothetical protein
MAYLWGWPLVNSVNRSKAFAEAPEPGLLGGIVPVAYGRNAMLTGYIDPGQTFVTCTNQDVVYGAGYMALDKEPIVFQVPDFGDRFWVYGHYDERTDEFSEIGKQYGTKPGFYMMVGPDWKGAKPAGITAVVRSSFSEGVVHWSDLPVPRTIATPIVAITMPAPITSAKAFGRPNQEAMKPIVGGPARKPK